MARPLTDQVIIITGASSGIGAATAVACAKAGMDVVLTARRADKLEIVAVQVRALGRRAELVPGDIAEAGMSARLLDAAARAFGRFDAVFANAGYGFERAMTAVSESDLRGIFEVNFFAATDLLQQAARRLIAARQPGHLLMCSSCLAKFSLPGHGPYCATKAAQNQVCRAMRIELRRHGVEVASVHPIGTRTEFFDASAERSGKQRSDETPPGFLMQPPERVANAVVRCLRRPRPEVWTSRSMRIIAGLMTMWPSMTDRLVRASERFRVDR